jgi:PTS hybrid protein
MRRLRPDRGSEVSGSPGKVGIVFVSHSVQIADGLVQLAAQMAQGTSLVAAGGTDEGGIGTSFEKVSAAVAAADSSEGVAVLCDLGSAILTAETALDFLDDDVRERVRIVSAPLVEGGVAAAVAAESGGSLAEVVAAGESAGAEYASAASTDPADSSSSAASSPEGSSGAPGAAGSPTSASGAVSAVGEPGGGYSRSVVVVNRDGLHARPAAEFVKLASTFDTRVTVNGKDAKSLLGIMSLGLTKGATVELASAAPEGAAAVDALADLVETGFGEV